MRPTSPLAACLALMSMWGCFEATPTVNDDPSSHLRVVHAVPNGPTLDLVIDGATASQGLAFGTVTSFLAVDHIVRNATPQDSASVNQPSPMPQGVSNRAVGAFVPGTPEPATWGAVLVLLSVLAMLARRARRQRPGRYTD